MDKKIDNPIKKTLSSMIGKELMVSCSKWLHCPDGKECRVIFGTLKDVCNDQEALGIKTDRGSANWYVKIGCMILPGCKVEYVTRVNREDVNFSTRDGWTIHEGKLSEYIVPFIIFDADKIDYD